MVSIGALLHQSGLSREPLAVPEAVDGREEHDHVEAEQDEDGRVEVELEGLDGQEAGEAADVGLLGLADGDQVVVDEGDYHKKNERKPPGDQGIQKIFERV